MTRWEVRVDGHATDAGPSESTFIIEASLGYLVNRAARLMAHELAERIRPAGVGIGAWAVLLFLWARDGMTQSELAGMVAIEPPTMVRTIDRMVRDGLVERRPDPKDRRVARIHLTDQGRSLRDDLIPEAIAVNQAVGGRLTPAESKTLHRLLAKLVADPSARQ